VTHWYRCCKLGGSIDEIENLQTVFLTMPPIQLQQSIRSINTRDAVAWAKVFDRTHDDDEHYQRRVADDSPRVNISRRLVHIVSGPNDFSAA
jgi:hypothetical protein